MNTLLRKMTPIGVPYFCSLLILLCLLSAPAKLAAQTTYTYNPGGLTSGTLSWSNTNTWSPSGIPGAGDTLLLTGGSGTTLGINASNRTVANIVFTNPTSALIGFVNDAANRTLTVTDTISKAGAFNLTLRGGAVDRVLTVVATTVNISGGAGVTAANDSLYIGAAATQPGIADFGTLNINTTANNLGGLFLFSLDGVTNNIDTVNLTQGRVVLRNLIGGTTTLNVGSLNGSGGIVTAANSSSGSNAVGILRLTNSSGTSVYSGILEDGFSTARLNIEKVGAGTQVLAGANTFNGYTLISEGVLQIGNGGATGALGAGLVTNNAVLAFNRNNAATVSNTISGNGQLVQAGSGTLTLSGVNSYTGGTAINAGALALGSADAIGSSGAISFGGGALRYSASNTTDYSSRLSTAAGQAVAIDTAGQNVIFATGLTSSGGSLTKIGTGTLTLSALNTFNGGTAVNGGTLLLSGGDNRLATNGSVSVASGAVLNLGGNTQTVSGLNGSGGITNSGGNLIVAGSGTFSGVISGVGGLVKDGEGVLVLGGINTYEGGTVINGGKISFNGASRISGNTGVMTFNGGTLLNTANAATTKLTTLNAGGGTFETAAGTTNTWNGSISGTGTLVKTGDGVLLLGGTNSTYEGGTVINGGIVSIPSDARLGASNGVVSFAGGTLRTTGNVSANRGTTINAGGATFEVGSGTTNTWNGNIGGVGGLTKADAGALILAGNNSYGGATTVSAGTLIVNGNSSAATGNLTVASGATLGGIGSIGGNTVVVGALSPGNSPGLLTFEGDLTLSGTALFEITGTSRGSLYDAVDVGGALTYGGTLTIDFSSPFAGSFNLFQFESYAGSFDNIFLTGGYEGQLTKNGSTWSTTINGVDFTFLDTSGVLNVVPEPSTYALLVLSGLGLAAHVIRRRHRLKA